ncbi:MAG: hypothetical protein GF317_00965 [Candidatus Lokiarchaeota archaeon]|nr:hypothetical protein [Candidatus Lokiarchaeota archaeon]MBD3198529.1 hypothetical protein [Candidatus Lokiarchaeota archaeon]
MTKEKPLTMCWFGFFTPYATSIVHVPEQVISPNEISKGELIFIWDKFMKSDVLNDLLGTPVPWSPALIRGYSRDWKENEDSSYECELVKNEGGQCLGAVLLISRLKENHLNPLIESYKSRGYSLKKHDILIGDLMRRITAFLP